MTVGAVDGMNLFTALPDVAADAPRLVVGRRARSMCDGWAHGEP